MKSHSSPNNSRIDERRAEDELLNGIMPCLVSNRWDKKGILFLGGNEAILFISLEDEKEPIISLKKRIYFNIRENYNLRNDNKK